MRKKKTIKTKFSRFHEKEKKWRKNLIKESKLVQLLCWHKQRRQPTLLLLTTIYIFWIITRNTHSFKLLPSLLSNRQIITFYFFKRNYISFHNGKKYSNKRRNYTRKTPKNSNFQLSWNTSTITGLKGRKKHEDIKQSE